MEIDSINKRICELIIRSVYAELSAGPELTSEEQTELAAWIQETPENSALYSRMTNLSYLKKKTEQYESINVDKYLSQFKREIERKRSWRFDRFYWMQITVAAAMVLLVIGINVFIQQREADPELITEPQLVASGIVPGGTNAVLILDDGSAVDLLGKEQLEVKEKDGSVIQGDSLGLSYAQKKKVEKEAERELTNQVITPVGGEYTLTLSDGTKVYLNSKSKLTYPVQFKGDNRVVNLEGEAYFEVAASKEHPFIVKTQDMDVKVVGTEFDLKAYADDYSVQMTLVTGSASVLTGLKKDKEIELKPDQQVEWRRDNEAFSVKNVDAELYGAWKDGMFIFKQERLENIMKALSRWYDMDVVYKDEMLKDIRFGGKLDKSGSIIPILNVISSTEHIYIELENKRIILSIK